MLNDLTNMFGPLDATTMGRIRSFLRIAEKPVRKPADAERLRLAWDDVSAIIIDSRKNVTLWQAWAAIDKTAPSRVTRDQRGRAVWPTTPDTFTLYRAIEAARQAIDCGEWRVGLLPSGWLS